MPRVTDRGAPSARYCRREGETPTTTHYPTPPVRDRPSRSYRPLSDSQKALLLAGQLIRLSFFETLKFALQVFYLNIEWISGIAFDTFVIALYF